MAISDFTEKEIRKAILNKIKPQKINKKASHWKGYIYIDNKFVTKVKIPNNHSRIMKESKSKFIARDLKINDDQFNDLIKCPLKGKVFYKIIESEL